MNTADIESFVGRFAQAWAKRSPEAFLDLWHPDGSLHYPFAGRVIRGDEIGLLNDVTRAAAPDLTWKLLGWTSRDDVVVIEWECTNRYGSQVLTWRGVDRLTLREGRIAEEVVYADTAPLQAFEPLIDLPRSAVRRHRYDLPERPRRKVRVFGRRIRVSRPLCLGTAGQGLR